MLVNENQVISLSHLHQSCCWRAAVVIDEVSVGVVVTINSWQDIR